MDVGGWPDGAQEGIEAGLLRRHVARCPHHGRDLREMAGGIVGAGKAEVGELRRAGIGGVGAGCEEDILRLDVAMDDADEMECFECPGEIAADPGGLSGSERAPFDLAPERLPCHPLHDEIGEPVGGAGGEDADDIGMIEARQQQGFALGPGPVVGGDPPGAGEHLHRHRPVERAVARFEDDPHPAAGDQLEVDQARDRRDRRLGGVEAGGDLEVRSVRGEFREGGVGLGTGLLPPGKTLEAPRGGDLLAEGTRRAVLEMREERVALGGGETIVEEILHRRLVGAA